jgi:lysophospholipase L1-like esterase
MKTVVCFGASLTAGTVSADYVAMLRARPALAGFRFENHGSNGDLAWNGLQRLHRVIGEAPDFVTILIGTNDANATLSERNRLRYLTFNHLPAEPTVAWYEENLRAIVAQLQAKTGARLAMLSLPPISEDPAHEAFHRIDPYNDAIRRVAADANVPYLPLHERMTAFLAEHESERAARPPRLAYRDGLINVGNALALHAQGLSWDDVSQRNGLLLQTDCLHLNSRGAGMIADLIESWLLEAAGRA